MPRGGAGKTRRPPKPHVKKQVKPKVTRIKKDIVRGLTPHSTLRVGGK